jgi:hypothetical protein
MDGYRDQDRCSDVGMDNSTRDIMEIYSCVLGAYARDGGNEEPINVLQGLSFFMI